MPVLLFRFFFLYLLSIVSAYYDVRFITFGLVLFAHVCYKRRHLARWWTLVNVTHEYSNSYTQLNGSWVCWTRAQALALATDVWKQISNHQYDLRAASLLHFLHTLSTRNAGNWTVYVRAFLCIKECALFVNAVFEHEWIKKVPQTTLGAERTFKSAVSLWVWNCSIHSTPVKSYATHVKSQSLTYEYKYSITHILTDH